MVIKRSRQLRKRKAEQLEEETVSADVDVAPAPALKKKRKRTHENAQNAPTLAGDARDSLEELDAGQKEELVADAGVSSTPMASKPTALFKKDTSFANLGLARWLVENCSKLGMRYPTEIQVMTVPPVLAGKNVAGNSNTGSGKTACYCLPMLHHLSQDPFGVFGLVLTPVRELAFQVSENFRALGRNINVQVGEVVGGRDMMTQSRMISDRSHIIVATPGRLADLLRGDPELARSFKPLRTLVLDEADQLLTQTFEEPLAEILGALPKKRQTLLFSATLTASIEKLTARIPDLVVKDANPRDDSLDNMTQQYVFVPRTVQICYLHYLLNAHFAESSCIVFTPTIEICQLLTTMLEILGFPVTGLHALQTQRQRQACLGKFKAGRCSILVATDVAARGLDIPKVAVVVNFGMPSHVDNYVHRAGRTARAGRPGLVVSLMTEMDVARVKPIEARIGRQLELRQTSEEEAVKLLSKTTKARQKAELLLSEIGFEEKVAEHREERNSRKGGRKARGSRAAAAL